MARAEGIYEFRENNIAKFTGTFKEFAKKENCTTSAIRYRLKSGQYTKKFIKESKFVGSKEQNAEAILFNYKIISADYENIQVVELENGDRAVMSKKTGKIIKSKTGFSRRARLLA